MPCAHCAREFSLFHREYACPGCGFSHCSSCLKYKVSHPSNLAWETLHCQVVLPKTGRQDKVCLKCHTTMTTPRPAPPPSPPKALQQRLEKLQPTGVSWEGHWVISNAITGAQRIGSGGPENCGEAGKITQGESDVF